MLRMLIVDDEPIIVEGLYELFLQSEHLELEIHQALDGVEALAIASKLRIDILLTDYSMPEMDGHELQLAITRIWPRCKVIFLSGYNDFEYIQTTMRSGADDFVLKTEGDETILAAVEKTIRAISEDHSFDRLIRDARTQMEQTLPAMRKDYLHALLNGDPEAMQRRHRSFGDLGIPLDAASPVYVFLGRVDRWRPDMASGDRDLFLFSVQNIVSEHFATGYALTGFIADQSRIVWLLQPAAPAESQREIVMGTLESIQTACKLYLKLTTSYVVTGEAVPWEQLPQAYDRLLLLFEKGLGLGEEMLLSDERLFSEDRRPSTAGVRRIRLLDQYLSHKDESRFYAHFDELMQAMEDEQTMHTGLALEVFYELAAIFISHLNRLDLFTEWSRSAPVGKLLSIREHRTWEEARAFFRDLAGLLFSRLNSGNEEASSEVVQTLHAYIDENLHGDLSLNRLSDLVYLTPFYVSRLYKQITHRSISDYIADKRVAAAKRLLGETPLKIHEVGIRIGYDSPAYFTRFFKKMTRMTPQEYRDSLKKI